MFWHPLGSIKNGFAFVFTDLNQVHVYIFLMNDISVFNFI